MTSAEIEKAIKCLKRDLTIPSEMSNLRQLTLFCRTKILTVLLCCLNSSAFNKIFNNSLTLFDQLDNTHCDDRLISNCDNAVLCFITVLYCHFVIVFLTILYFL